MEVSLANRERHIRDRYHNGRNRESTSDSISSDLKVARRIINNNDIRAIRSQRQINLGSCHADAAVGSLLKAKVTGQNLIGDIQANIVTRDKEERSGRKRQRSRLSEDRVAFINRSARGIHLEPEVSTGRDTRHFKAK